MKRIQLRAPLRIVIAVLAVLAFVAVGTVLLRGSRAATPVVAAEAENGTLSSCAAKVTDTTASGGSAAKFTTCAPPPSGCTISAILVNSCRPWLAGYANGYPQVASDGKSQTLYHEQRIGRQLDVVHTYHGLGRNTLNSEEVYYATRANTILDTNWKPGHPWSSAAGGNASVNATIDQMANSIKSVAPHKIILNVYHEPENDISAGMTCQAYVTGASGGSPADYRAMWANVRKRFDALGVTNVVWSMNYMGSSKWACIIKEMWPGNNLVDWVMWDPYVNSDTATYDGSVGYFYNWLVNNTDSTHDFSSKPFGTNEWSAFTGVSQTRVNQMLKDAKVSLDSNTFPKIKLFNYFDTTNQDGDFRVGYNTSGVLDSNEQALYNAFAQDPRFTDAFYP